MLFGTEPAGTINDPLTRPWRVSTYPSFLYLPPVLGTGRTMDHFIEDLDQTDVAEVEERTNAAGDEISGLVLVVF
jgi:hypothetical protein